MIKLMKYLKKSAGYVVLIIALLFLQAYCDLSLPDYTSKIVNVGIQQSGIEDSVPEKIRKTSMDNLKLFMDEEDKETIYSYYEEDGDNLVLKDDVKSEEREKLNDILVKPMMIAASFSSGSDEVNEMLAKMGVPEGTDPMQAIAQLPEEALTSMIEKISEKIDKMQPSILTQAGVAYVKSEYEAMGEDVDAIQMHYIKISGVKMLGMALITMLCAICVVFLSSRVAAALGHDLRNAVYNKVISFSSREYHKFSTASLITRCTNDIQQVQQVMAMFFRIVLYAPILGIGGVIRVLKTDSSMTWILGLAVGLILVVIVVLFQVAMPKFTILQTLVDKLNLVTREILTGIPVIRAFSREKHEEERFEEANLRLTKTNLFVNRCMTFMMPTMMLIMNGVSVLIIYSGSYAVDNGTMQVGNVMAFIQYAMQIIMSFLMITAMSIMLPRANVAALRINDILKTKVSVIDPKNPVQPDANVKGPVEF
ncbi:MAG: ABC transporter ATP-binding protein, partial [Blautia obeum]|nr:ABC transporter ATP-binding protein [Blautia obeum]